MHALTPMARPGEAAHGEDPTTAPRSAGTVTSIGERAKGADTARRSATRQEAGRSSEGNDMGTTYAIRRRGLQSEIQQIVKRYIIDHQFRPGDPLPGEGELARQIGISRPSLREAMKVLQTIGAIETRHGSGTYVGSLSFDSLAEGLAFQLGVAAQHSDGPPAEMLDLIELREAVEARQIARVAGLHTEAEIRQMRQLNDQLRTAEIPTGFRSRDFDLHRSFYTPLKSRITGEFIQCFWKVSNIAAYPFDEGQRDRIVSEHDTIIDALESGDAEAASRAMTRHLEKMVQTVEAAYDLDVLSDNAIMPGGEATY